MCLFCISCSGVRPIELFYTGTNSTMYFIRPFTIKGDEGDTEMDITYRYTADKNDTNKVVCKFTFYSEWAGIEKVKDVYFLLQPESTKITLTNINRYYVERDNNIARYEARISYDDSRKLSLHRHVHSTLPYPPQLLSMVPKVPSTKYVKLSREK
jgi:hypothetical protein